MEAGSMQSAYTVDHPTEVRSSIPAVSREKALLLPLTLFAAAASLYAVTWVLIFVIHGPARLLMSLLNGFFIGVLFIVAHDACHGSFVPKRWLNMAIGRLAFLPSLHTFSFWELGHNRLHHGWTNLKDKDYAWAPLAKEEFNEVGSGRKMLERVGRTFFGVALYYAVVVWWSHMAFPNAEDRRRVDLWRGRLDRFFVLTFLVLQCALGYELETRRGAEGLSGLGSSFLFGVAVPFVMYNWMAGILTFVQHTHERARWYAGREEWSLATGVLRGTVHVIFPSAVDLILYNVMFHTAHHADTRIPLYHLPEAQRALEEHHPESVIQVRFSLGGVRETLRRCKLYDYRQHRWLDFRGNPTEVSSLVHDGFARPIDDPSRPSDAPTLPKDGSSGHAEHSSLSSKARALSLDASRR